jgi:hypothetical protein
MVVQAGRGEMSLGGDVFHGGGFIATVTQHFRRGDEDFVCADGLIGGFARHTMTLQLLI